MQGVGCTPGNLKRTLDRDLKQVDTPSQRVESPIRTLEGVFHHVAEEERRIREHPLARTSDLLTKVFGG